METQDCQKALGFPKTPAPNKGECAIIADNADDQAEEYVHDPAPGLAVVIYPPIAIFTDEDYAGHVFGTSGSSELENELL